MPYTPNAVPTDPAALSDFLTRELQSLSSNDTQQRPHLFLQTLNVAPTKPREGMIAKVDGTHWNPGFGAAPYYYRGGAWVAMDKIPAVPDYPGADPTGVADSGAAVAAATIAAREVLFPAGTWLAAATPTITGNTSLVTQAGATFTGAGMAALGFTAGAQQQRIQFNTTGTDFATSYFRRNASHSGGTAGFVSGCVKVETYVTNAGATNYEWAFTAKVDNSATAGQNVAGYFQGIKRSTGPTWGMTAEAIDTTGTANPGTGLVAAEIDIRANGTDTSNQRIGIDVVITRQLSGGVPSGTAMQAGYGVRVQNSGDGANSVVTAAFGVTANAVVGVDTSAAVITQAAFKMAQGQALAFNAAATRQLSHNGSGWVFNNNGTSAATIVDTGAYLVGANQVLGSRETGWTAMTGTANKATSYDTATVTLAQLAGRVLSLQAALTTHGLIGA